jgi:hypothetical protein
MLPAVESIDAPVEREIEPLSPVAVVLGVDISIAPLDDETPMPDVSSILPPVKYSAAPAAKTMEEPISESEVVDPDAIVISPAALRCNTGK